MKQCLKMHGVHQPQITHEKKHLIITNNMSTSQQLGHQILNKESSLQNLKKNSLPIFSNQPRISRPHDSPHLQRPNDYLVKCLRVAVPNEDLQPRCPRPRGSYTVLPHTILAVEDPWPRVWGESDSGDVRRDVGPRSPTFCPLKGKSLYKPYIKWVFMGYNPQESLENTINTMGTVLGGRPNCPLIDIFWDYICWILWILRLIYWDYDIGILVYYILLYSILVYIEISYPIEIILWDYNTIGIYPSNKQT